MLKILRLVFLMTIFFSTSNVLYADGKFYVPEDIPLNIPYQRALLIYNGSTETLLLQSKYQAKLSKKSVTSLGWVVPVPAVPKLAYLHPFLAERVFEKAWRITYPNVIRIWGDGYLILSGVIILLIPIGIVITLWIRKNQGGIFPQVAVISLLAVLAFIILLPYSAKPRGNEAPIEEIKAERVGIYDVRVVKGKSPGELIQWLNDNKFRFDQSDAQIFDRYIKRGWCFVVAKVRPEEVAKDELAVIGPQGLVAPLVLQFQTKQPIYPLALTATANHDTLIHLYVLSNRKVDCDSKLKLFYAGQKYPLLDDDYQTEPEKLFSKEVYDLSYLTVFKGTLTPEQMRQDAQLTFASDNEPYRETIIQW